MKNISTRRVNSYPDVDRELDNLRGLIKTIPDDSASISGINGLGLFRSKEIKVISNTSAETTTKATVYRGDSTIPANFINIGDKIVIKAMGYLSTTGTPTSTIRIKFNNTSLITNTSTLLLNMSNQYFDLLVEIVCLDTGLNGKFFLCGRTIIQGGVGITTSSIRGLVNTSSNTVDTTNKQLIDLTYQWGTASASNVLNVVNSEIYIIKDLS